MSVLSDHIQQSEYQRSGKVLKIVLKNFMCHSNLKLDFNLRVNLLVGNNGSGKSAILTALIIGLGCKASTSNRSSNITRKTLARIVLVFYLTIFTIFQSSLNVVKDLVQLKSICRIIKKLDMNLISTEKQLL